MSGGRDHKRTLAEIKRLGKQKCQDHGQDQNERAVCDVYAMATKAKYMVASQRTALVYSDKFMDHKCTWDTNYPEKPERYMSVMDRLNHYGLVDRCLFVPPTTEVANTWELVTERLNKLHTSEHVKRLENIRGSTEGELEKMAELYDAIYFNQETYDCAVLSAGGCLEATNAVLSGRTQNAMAIVRPPGHHASKDEYNGYCFFNNVALAAENALDNSLAERILIVDFDVHHGQGTQRFFYEDPRVLYFSIHRYENGSFWPELRESNFDYIGRDEGEGFNVNVPLNQTGCGDVDYLLIIQLLLLPMAYEFDPDLILVSAGYDAAIGCPEGQMLVTPGFYHHIITSLMGLACGKVVVCLEGGYFLPSLAECAAQTLRALLGDAAPKLELLGNPKNHVLQSIYNVIAVHRHKWMCFAQYMPRPISETDEIYQHKVRVCYIGNTLKPPFETRNCYAQNSKEQDNLFAHEVIRLQTNFYKNFVTVVGLVTNSRMELHCDPGDNQFEKPDRLPVTLKCFEEFNILKRFLRMQGLYAPDNKLKLGHTMDYINKIKVKQDCNCQEIQNTEDWVTVYTCKATYESAAIAAGSVVQTVDDIKTGIITSAIALIRPPGHHAFEDAAQGFCIFNNIVIGAKHALQEGFQRILIVDWDVHHGNGIQRAFYDTDKVLYISIHRFDDGTFFPKSSDAQFIQIGEGVGRYYNVNIPFSGKKHEKIGDAEYMATFMRVVLPIAYEFNPELVFVAAGFDAAVGDPLGRYNVSPEAFGHFTQLLKPLAGGKMILCLEGGYNVNSVAYSMTMCAKALLGDPIPPITNLGLVHDSVQTIIRDVIQIQSQKWNLLTRLVNILPVDKETYSDTDPPQ